MQRIQQSGDRPAIMNLLPPENDQNDHENVIIMMIVHCPVIVNLLPPEDEMDKDANDAGAVNVNGDGGNGDDVDVDNGDGNR